MPPLVLITGISLYIISIVVALLLAIASAKVRPSVQKKLIALHFLFVMVAAVILIAGFVNSSLISWGPYASVIAFCSGLAFSGMILRSQMNLPLKIYFAIYLLSIVAFIITPSKLFSFIATGKIFSNTENTFALGNNYFLESQSAMINSKKSLPKYKIYKRMGYFNKTIVRDIEFGRTLDSVKVLLFDEGKNALLRGFSFNQSRMDSVDVNIDLSKALKANTITKGK